jgi:predicted kinase
MRRWPGVTTVELPVPVVPPRARPPAPRRPERDRRGSGGTAPVRLRLPGRALLLVAGLPGAGKSTLLARLPRRPGFALLDSDTHRAALGRRFPGLAYRRYRPLVHLLHRLALVRAACSATPTVVVHLPATAAVTRTAVALLAVLTGRAAYLLWVHADAAEALRGQRERGRVVPSGSFAGHARRAAGLRRRLLRGRVRGFRGVAVVDRTAVRAGLVLDTPPVL